MLMACGYIGIILRVICDLEIGLRSSGFDLGLEGPGLDLGLGLEGPGLGLVLGLWILSLTTTLLHRSIASLDCVGSASGWAGLDWVT